MRIRFAEHFNLTEREVQETPLSWLLACLAVMAEDAKVRRYEAKRAEQKSRSRR